MRRFLGIWALLSPAYLVAAGLSSWLVLNLVDLTYEAYAAWLLVPVAQALALSVASPRGPLLPRGRPALAAVAPPALAVAVVAAGLLSPRDEIWGLLAAESLQPLLPRALALLAGVAFLAAAVLARTGRARLAALGTLLLLLGLDAVRPWLHGLPEALLPERGAFAGGLLGYGALLVLLFAAALSAQRVLEGRSPWAGRLLGAALAFLFGALHGALLQLFLHPWLEEPWSLLVPAAVSFAAALAAASGLAALLPPREEP